MTRRILHPSDFSPAADAALKKAIDLTKTGRGGLLVVHVINPIVPLAGEGYVSPKTYEDIAASTRAWAKKRLDQRLVKAKKSGARAKGLLVEGSAYEQIVRVAKSRHADLIVMGTHGRSGIAKLFLGSVAGRVVAAAPCPVMTVRRT
ncbi:MAG: universal stress protein [Candidatus Rokuibacteriota bacterium]